MNTQVIKNTAKIITSTAAKNSPTILTGLGVAGMFATAIMGITATPKALRLIEEEELKVGELTKTEIVKTTWKVYVPTAAMGLVTAGCIIGANSINLRRNAALASLYSLSETALKEYQAKVIKKIGRDKQREIEEELAQDKIDRDPVSRHEVIVGKGEILCYDDLSGRYFWSSMEEIKSAVNKVSRRMMSDMFVPLNDIYYELDIEGTKTGELLGWHIDDGIIEPSFNSTITEDGRPCLVLQFDIEPRYYKMDH